MITEIKMWIAYVCFLIAVISPIDSLKILFFIIGCGFLGDLAGKADGYR